MKLARAAATLLAMAVLVACSDDPEPRIEPSESPSTGSTSQEPSPDARSIEEAFITDFVRAVSDALSTGDPAAFLSMTDDRCANCQTLADNLRNAYRDGGRVVGGNWQVVSLDFREQTNLGSIWDVDVRTSREVWLDADGETIKTIAADVARFGFAIASDGEEPILRNMRLRS